MVIVSGSVKVVKKLASGAELELGILGPGQFVGEIALLNESPRSATVISRGLTECLVLPKSSFDTVIESHPEIAQKVSGVAQQRERDLAEMQVRREQEEELRTAHEMQMGLMPSTPPATSALDVAGVCRPASQVGGDFFQYFAVEDTITVAIADVTGHAMEAAIPVVMFSGILAQRMEFPGTLEERFHSLNRSLCRTLGDHKFICFTMAEFDTATRCLKLASCGNPYPLHFHNGQVDELCVDGYPFGVRPDTTYEVIDRRLLPEEYLVFYSDGVPEALTSAGEMFGFDSVAATVQAACQEGASADEVIERLMGAARAFAGDSPQSDDMTCVVVRVEDENPAAEIKKTDVAN